VFILFRSGVAPYWDDYAIGKFLIRTADRGWPAWSDLIAQHNESRKFFPRLIYWILALPGQWDVRRQMVVHWGFLLASMLALISLSRATLPASLSLTCSTLGAFVLFSLAQWQNLLWGIQVVVVIPTFSLFCGIWCLWVPRWHVGIRVALAAILAVFSTFSYANGMVVWALLGLAVLFAPRALPRPRAVATTLFAFAGGIAIWYFFLGWSRSGAFVAVSYTPTQILQFALAFIGNGLRFTTDVNMAVAAGAFGALVALMSFTGLALHCAIRRTWDPLFSALPWCLLMGYSFLSGCAAAVGRLSYGLEAAIAMRYPTFAIPFWVALLPMVTLFLLSFRVISVERIRRTSIFGAGMVFCLVLMAQFLALRESSSYVRDRVIAESTLRWIHVAPSPTYIASKIYPSLTIPQETFSGLVRVKLSPIKINTDVLAENYPPPADSSWSKQARGSLDHLQWEGNLVRARGWALSPRSPEKAADALLLSAVLPSGQHQIFALAPNVSLPRSDVPRVFGANHNSNAGWEIVFDPEPHLKGGEMITLYAFDTESNSLTPINSFRLLPERPDVLPPTPEIKQFVEDYAALPADLADLYYTFGSFQSINWIGNQLFADGWAISSRSPSRPAEAVILSVTQSNGRNRIVAIVPKITAPRFDVPENLGNLYSPLVGWDVTFTPPPNLPSAGIVTAWIYDSSSGSLRKIPKSLPIPPKP